MSKTERIELRVSADDKEAIAAAAAMEHTTTTEFVRDAVLDRAQHVRARRPHPHACRAVRLTGRRA